MIIVVRYRTFARFNFKLGLKTDSIIFIKKGKTENRFPSDLHSSSIIRTSDFEINADLRFYFLLQRLCYGVKRASLALKPPAQRRSHAHTAEQ